MNRFDIIILVIILWYGLRGLVRGVWSELLDVCLFVVSIVFSVFLIEGFAEWLTGVIHIPLSLSTLIGFPILYCMISVLLRLAVRFLRNRRKPSFFLRIWGLGIGLLRGVFAAGIFAFLISNFLAIQKPHWGKEKSLLVRPVCAVASAVYEVMIITVPKSKSVFERMKHDFGDFADRNENGVNSNTLKK
jgi:uncharacterized membrane protein required for colicin V production